MESVINTMEVLATKPLNELVTEAIIKVCYVSDKPNNNNTIINKEVGKEIAASLPGAPVAGFFNKKDGDFEEHNRVKKFINGELVFEDITRPYGFVSPTDKPWYQDFTEDGEVKTYLMCKAFFWTRQYEEASLALNKGQSMELDEKQFSGYYQGDVFVFTSATLDKLCILGDNFAPCFSGAKIIKTYCKQFNDLAKQLEKDIGRRYYVMNDKLVIEPKAITLDYAVEIGFNLTDAIYAQLANRDSQGVYCVKGIYSENGVIFTILQNRESLEYVKCIIKITDQETVELEAEMQAVTQTWVTKLTAEKEPVASLNGGEGVAPEQEIPMNVAATYTEGGDPNTVSEAISVNATKTKSSTAESIDANFKNNDNTSDFINKIKKMDLELSAFALKVKKFENKILEKDNEISALTDTIAKYKQIESEIMTSKKEDMVNLYKMLLNEEEIGEITSNIEKYSLDELESKLSITYARKQRSNISTNNNMQVNINTTVSEIELPDFIRQAQEYDKNREFRLI